MINVNDWKLAKADWPRPGSPKCSICGELVDGKFYWDQDEIAHKTCVDNDVQPGNNRDDNLTCVILKDISSSLKSIIALASVEWNIQNEILISIKDFEKDRNDMLRNAYGTKEKIQ